jgi:diguanylate cyclase (GGDEF)-like protein
MALSASHLLKQEYSQAITRIVIVSIIFIYLLFEEHKLETILVTSIYFLYSIFNIYSIIVQNRESSYRRVFNIIGDLSVMAYVIYIGNYNAIIIYPALLWLIIGYGMRFGVKSLLITLLVSEIALTILMMHDPYWRIQDSITYSIIVSLAGLSMFYLFLIKKMHDANDILEEKVSLRVSEMKHLYLHDSLTSLKNRVALVDDLKEDPISGLILIDINNFHNYNELYGMEIGNKVLKDFSSHLKFSKIARKYELYRIYGDHFILRKISSEINEKILKSDIKEIFTIFQEFKINIENLDDILDIDITIGASLGKENVLKMAEMALKYAKSTKKHYSIYTNDIDNTSYSQEFLVWKKRIKQALISNNIIPVYQAIVDKEGNIVKYEDLMRLREENNNIE